MTLPYDVYPSVLAAIGFVSQGYTVTEACRRVEPSSLPVATFRRYITKSPELQEMFADAEQQSHDAMADALINIDHDDVHGGRDPKMAKIISDNIKWVLSKRDNKRFGDRVEVAHSVTVDLAITTALDAARMRVGQVVPQEILDAVVVNDDEALLRDLLS